MYYLHPTYHCGDTHNNTIVISCCCCCRFMTSVHNNLVLKSVYTEFAKKRFPVPVILTVWCSVIGTKGSDMIYTMIWGYRYAYTWFGGTYLQFGYTFGWFEYMGRYLSAFGEIPIRLYARTGKVLCLGSFCTSYRSSTDYCTFLLVLSVVDRTTSSR